MTIHMGARRVLLILFLTTHNFSSFPLFNSLNSGLLTSPVVVFIFLGWITLLSHSELRYFVGTGNRKIEMDVL
jgi:hypothetical protein